MYNVTVLWLIATRNNLLCFNGDTLLSLFSGYHKSPQQMTVPAWGMRCASSGTADLLRVSALLRGTSKRHQEPQGWAEQALLAAPASHPRHISQRSGSVAPRLKQSKEQTELLTLPPSDAPSFSSLSTATSCVTLVKVFWHYFNRHADSSPALI